MAHENFAVVLRFPRENIVTPERGLDQAVPVAINAGIVFERRREVLAIGIRNEHTVALAATSSADDDTHARNRSSSMKIAAAIGDPYISETVHRRARWISEFPMVLAEIITRGRGILTDDLAGIGVDSRDGSPRRTGDVDVGERRGIIVHLELVRNFVVVNAHQHAFLKVGVSGVSPRDAGIPA